LISPFSYDIILLQRNKRTSSEDAGLWRAEFKSAYPRAVRPVVGGVCRRGFGLLLLNEAGHWFPVCAFGDKEITVRIRSNSHYRIFLVFD